MKTTGTFFLTRDNLKLGLVLGLLMPIVIMGLIYLFRYSQDYGFNEFTRTLFQQRQLITFLGVWSLVGNIALFTYYINTGKDRTAKGIFAVTLVYGIAILLVKLFI